MFTRNRKLTLIAVTFLVGFSLTEPAASGVAVPSGNTFVVEMDNMNFGRLPVEATVGDTIIWVNKDTVQHTATARDRSFDIRLQPRQKGRRVLKNAGTVAIYCIYHPAMRATLKVAPGGS